MKLARRRASFAPKGTIGEGTFFPGSSFRQSNQAVSRQAAVLQTGKERSHLKPSHTNERKESFCAHYVLTGNPEEAARLAGYPPEEAAAAGLTLLRQCSIQRSIQSLQRAYLERPQELVQAGLARLAFGSGADAVSLLLSGEERSPQQLRQMDLFNLSAVKRDKSGGVELHFFDRQRALERMYEYANSATGKEAAQNLLAALAGSGAQQDGDETESLLP